MAVHRIYPQQDTTIWSKPSITGKYGNAGKDEILEIGGYPDSDNPTLGRTKRALLQFKTSEIVNTINNTTSGFISASINLTLATANELPHSYTIYCHPVSQSWTSGIGKLNDSPVNTSGCSWEYRDASTNSWSTLGGDYTNSYTGSQTNDLLSNHNLSIDISNIVTQQYSSSIPNYGVLLKLQNEYENYVSSSIVLKYYGSNTNTIFDPYLEFKWDDSSYSSTLTELSTDICTVNIKNHREKYTLGDDVRFRISARPKYPTREFTTSSIYLTEYKLPSNSYYGIKDEYSNQMIVDFDTVYTKISADNTSSFFDTNMGMFKPNRFYRVLVKTTLNNNTVVLDSECVFKVVKHG